MAGLQSLAFFFTKAYDTYFWLSTDFFSNRLKTSRVYALKFGSQEIPVYCHMGDFGCGGGGWTLAMKIDGTKVHVFQERHFVFVIWISIF